jgi:alpha-D-ribose 1-methylphosphonate 5-triphosphate synthase subunit PhnH
MTWDEVHDSRAGFRACLEALSRPGTAVAEVPRPRLRDDPATDAAAGVLLSLLDSGLALACSGGPALDALGSTLRELTGAAAADVGEADFVLAGPGRDPALATRARRGSALAPDRGATLVVAPCPDERCAVELRGPGLAGAVTVDVPLGRTEVAALRLANARPPAGVDVLATTAGGALVGLPRSVLGG